MEPTTRLRNTFPASTPSVQPGRRACFVPGTLRKNHASTQQDRLLFPAKYLRRRPPSPPGVALVSPRRKGIERCWASTRRTRRRRSYAVFQSRGFNASQKDRVTGQAGRGIVFKQARWAMFGCDGGRRAPVRKLAGFEIRRNRSPRSSPDTAHWVENRSPDKLRPRVPQPQQYNRQKL